MKAKLVIFVLLLFNIIGDVTDPFSNVTENFKDINLIAISSCQDNYCALLDIKGKVELVSKNSVLSDNNGKWKVIDITLDKKDNGVVTISHLTSGKEYCLTI